MPESKSRKSAAAKKKAATSRKTTERQLANADREARTAGTGQNSLRDRAREATAAKQKAARSDDDTPPTRKRATATAESDPAPKRPLSTAERRRLQRSADDQPRRRTPVSRRWVPPTFITVGLIGVAWLITYYIAGVSGIQIPYMMDWGNWNILIGMGLMGTAFGLATLWK